MVAGMVGWMREEKEEKFLENFLCIDFLSGQGKNFKKFFGVPVAKVIKKLVGKKLGQKTHFQTGP